MTVGQQLFLAVVKILVIFQVLLGLFSFMTYVERRVLAFMQFRLGPNRTGPFGLLQPVADGIKLFFKEDVVPAGANRWVFILAPVVGIATAFTAIAVIPYGGFVTLPHFTSPASLSWFAFLSGLRVPLQIADIDVGLLFIFAITALGVYAIVMAGWSANNKYSLIGGLRSSAQMFSYELALGLSWVGIIMLAGSFRIYDIVAAQAGYDSTWVPGYLFHWNWFVQFPAFVIYAIASAAEVSRTPFDLPEAETELVAGFHVEYSSMKFALLQMAEYVNMITVSVLATDLFLGGWLAPAPWLQYLPIPGHPQHPLNLGLLWFGAKVLFYLFVFIWLRATLPRLRYDQLMHFGWKYLIPTATVWVLVTATWVTLQVAR